MPHTRSVCRPLLSGLLTSSLLLPHAGWSASPYPAASSTSRPAADSSTPASDTIDHVLTVSGGISLGSYEAGYNWAFIRYIKAHDRVDRREGRPAMNLLAMTGASAGNINAFLSAIAWCESEERQTSARHNLFWDAWIPIGWDRLFPDGLSCKEYQKKFDPEMECPTDKVYIAGDGLFTQRAFREIEHRLATAVSALPAEKAPFNDCHLPIGVTVTPEVPDELRIDELKIPTQRLAVAFLARKAGTDLGFYAIPEEDPRLGKYLHLPTDQDGRVPVERLLSLVEASSAFPVAFGPKTLQYCDEEHNLHRDTGTAVGLEPGAGAPARPTAAAPRRISCRADDRLPKLRFLDGGLYDNVPLGLAESLVGYAEQAPAQNANGAGQVGSPAGKGPRNIELFYVDPDRRRSHEDAPSKPPTSSELLGTSYLSKLAGNFVTVSRKYELQTVQRQRPNQTDSFRIDLSSRFAPIYGAYLASFAAFMARPFREHDYYVGVYDALHNLAEQQCLRNRATQQWTGEQQAACVLSEIYHGHQSLKLQEDEDGSYVIRTLAQRELGGWLPPGQLEPLLRKTVLPAGAAPGPLTASEWLRDGRSENVLLKTLMEVIDQSDRANPGRFDSLMEALNKALSEREREPTVKALLITRNRDLLPPTAPASSHTTFTPAERNSIRDYERWQLQALERLVVRMKNIELEDVKRSGIKSDYALGAYSVGGLTAATMQSQRAMGFHSRTTARHWLTRLLPHELLIFPGHGGAEVNWRQDFGLSRDVALGAVVSPYSWWRKSQVSAAVGLNLLLWRHGLGFSGIELGGRVNMDYRQFQQAGEYTNGLSLDRVSPGGELAAYFLGGKIRVGLSVRQGLNDDFQRRFQPELSLGLADFNGIIDWLATEH